MRTASVQRLFAIGDEVVRGIPYHWVNMLNTRVHRVIQVILLSVCLLWATSQQTRAETTPADQPITHGNPTQPRIALTFDACETPRQKPSFDAAIVITML